MKSEPQLCDGFIRSCEQFPERPAINVGREVTYRELANEQSVSRQHCKAKGDRRSPAHGRLRISFGNSICRCPGSIDGWPWLCALNRTFPVDRTRLMLRKSMARSIIVDAGSEPQLKALLTGLETSLLCFAPTGGRERVGG